MAAVPTLPSLPGAVNESTAEFCPKLPAVRLLIAAGGVVSGTTGVAVVKVLSPEETVLPEASTETTW